MHGDDGEEEERRRQAIERADMSPMDRAYGKPPKDRRGKRRRGRLVQMALRMQLKVKAVVDLIIDGHEHDGLPELFEIMVADYLEKYGGIDASLVPSEEELVERYLRKQDDKDAE
jgi:hypothetical protein